MNEEKVLTLLARNRGQEVHASDDLSLLDAFLRSIRYGRASGLNAVSGDDFFRATGVSRLYLNEDLYIYRVGEYDLEFLADHWDLFVHDFVVTG